MLQTQHIVVNGVRCALHDSAPQASREAVVFVHGNPGPMDDWSVLAPRVAQFARVVAMDLPGYGRAEHPHHFDFTVDGYAKYLGALLDQIHVERAHLVLHDFGGAFGLAWAAANPAKVASITLINIGNLRGYRWHKLARIWQTPILGELFQAVMTRPLIELALNADNPKPMPREFIDRLVSFADWPHRRAVLALYRASRNPEEHLVHHMPDSLTRELQVCVIWGAEDKYLPVRYAAAQREELPRAQVHELHGLGHWPFVDDPSAVGDILVPFLKRQITTPLQLAAQVREVE